MRERSRSWRGPGLTAEGSRWAGEDLPGSAAAVRGGGTRADHCSSAGSCCHSPQLSQLSQLVATAVHSSLPQIKSPAYGNTADWGLQRPRTRQTVAPLSPSITKTEAHTFAAPGRFGTVHLSESQAARWRWRGKGVWARIVVQGAGFVSPEAWAIPPHPSLTFSSAQGLVVSTNIKPLGCRRPASHQHVP